MVYLGRRLNVCDSYPARFSAIPQALDDQTGTESYPNRGGHPWPTRTKPLSVWSAALASPSALTSRSSSQARVSPMNQNAVLIADRLGGDSVPGRKVAGFGGRWGGG